jgi:citrate lyase subunit beta/citryl-CoA lyase
MSGSRDGRAPIRSLLFAPASDARKAARLGDFSADAVVLDLEDAVASTAKAAARSTIAEQVGALQAHGFVSVRINALTTGLAEADLECSIVPGLDAIVLPKVESADDVDTLDSHLADLERSRGMPAGGVAILAIVETARGVNAAEQIAASRSARLHTLILGSGDLTTDVGLDPDVDAASLAYARSRIVFAVAAAPNLAPAIDGPFMAFRDLEALRGDSARSRAFGFRGRVVVYPGQVETVNTVYSASHIHIASARRIVEEFERAERAGIAAIDIGGSFVDYPIYERARRVLLGEHSAPDESRR